jgi:diguanylate cyclase (GGDEF)-like protein
VRLLTRRAAELLGLQTRVKREGTTLHQLLPRCRCLGPEARTSIAAAVKEAGEEATQILLTLHDGRAPHATRPRSLSLDMRPAGRLGWVLSLEDVTQTRQAQDWLLEHVSTDPVTGLWNRQHFMLMLHDVLNSLRPTDPAPFVVLIGLRSFKHVNIMMGAATGDHLLRLVTDRIGSRMHEDDMLARFGGEEFAIAGTRPDERQAREFCRALIDALAAPYLIDSHLVTLSPHVGLAHASGYGESAETLAANAAMALLEARADSTTHLCVFEPDLGERAQRRRALEFDLRQALERGEFELFYQPQVDVHCGRVTGLEALIRWRSPARGMVPPVQFISLAEQMGLIGGIGEWVLREACREAMRWPPEVTVAVNASPLQFESGDFAAAVADALASSSLPASRLEIEITENLLLRDTGTVMNTLAALHAQGVRLVLDDFGTGYASLSQLSRFRFDKIKIDRSFISPDDASSQNSAIVRSIAALGQSLGIPTTAEGVETAKQLEQIKADGCTLVQGYIFSRPVPANEVATLIDRLQCPVSQEAA